MQNFFFKPILENIEKERPICYYICQKYLYIIIGVFLFGCHSGKFINKSISYNETDSLTQSLSIDYDYSFTEAAKQKILGNYTQALNLLYHCMEIQPDNAAVYYQSSEIYSLNNNVNMALYFANKCVLLQPKNVWYNLLLAKLYSNANKIDSTVYVYEKIVKLSPSNYEYKLNLSLLYLQAGKSKKAENLLTKIKENTGLNDEVAITLYQLYKLKNSDKKCIEILNEAIAIYPDKTKFYGLLAEQYVSMNEFDTALGYYNKLLEIDPENENGLLSLIEYYRIIKNYSKVISFSHEYIANSNFKITNKLELFVNILSDNKLLAEQSDSILLLIKQAINTHPDEFKFHTIAADFYIKRNKYPDAKRELIYIAEKTPENYLIWEQLLYILNSLSEYKDICIYTDSILTRFNDKPIVYLLRGIACYHMKKYDDALSSLKTGLTYNHGNKELNIQFYTFLGETYNALKEYGNSDFFFDKSLQLDSTNLYVLNNYSYYLSLRGEKLDVALKNIRKCINFNPNSFTYLDTYAWILFKKGLISEAKNIMEKAIFNGGNKDAEVLEHYIEILFYNGNREESLKYYQILKTIREPDSKIKLLLNNEM